jgi:Uma2 family endonuclease
VVCDPRPGLLEYGHACPPRAPSLTPEEYLAIEERSETKSEYYRGEIFAMAGSTIEHGQISTNLTIAIGAAVRGTTSQLFGADVRLHVSGHSLFTGVEFPR